jgi:queuosine precursor transporter
VFGALITKLKEFFKEKEESANKYVIISSMENHANTDKIHVKIRIKGTSKIFCKAVSEIYNEEWLENFSKEDTAYIAVLYYSEQTKDPDLIRFFPRKKQLITKNATIIAILFIAFLIASNFTAIKITELNLSQIPIINLFTSSHLFFPAGLIFFPITYFFSDILTEVYGFKISRLIIWSGMICSIFITLLAKTSVYLPSATVWNNQGAYSLVFDASLRVALASALAYFFGEFFNAIILSRMKILTAGKWFTFRIVTSTSIAAIIDSILFCNLSFLGTLPYNIIWHMVLIQYMFKMGYELVLLPILYFVTGYLKRSDKVDYYDYTTKFNPFSLKLCD